VLLLFRSILFIGVFYLNTALFLILGSPLLLGPRRWAMIGLRAHARASLFWMRVIAGTRMEVRGLERLPDGPVLVCAKHQSAWDTFALIPLFRDPAMVMKAELGNIPLYGWFSRKFEHVLIERERGPVALRHMIRDANARAAQGREIVIFPEGTRTTPGAPADYKPGALALYDGLNVPCVPLALNSGLYWPRRSLMRYPGKIIVEILYPIPPGLPRAEFRKRLIEAIETASERLIVEASESATPPPTARLALPSQKKQTENI
jgi:1-acyl-sn-glycerol-3-phosphate acyltransferase